MRGISSLLKCCIKSSKENHFCNLFFYLINSFIQTDFKIKKIIVIIENLISTSQSFSGLVFIIMLVRSFFVPVVNTLIQNIELNYFPIIYFKSYFFKVIK